VSIPDGRVANCEKNSEGRRNFWVFSFSIFNRFYL
jgi:hypothetical protein